MLRGRKFVEDFGTGGGMRFITQTDVVGASWVNDDNQKIGVEADKLTVFREHILFIRYKMVQ